MSQRVMADDGHLRRHLGGLDQICAANSKVSKDGYSVGTTMTVADLAIWRLVGWIDGGSLDGIPRNYVRDTFPHLATLVATVDAHPPVQAWKKKHAKFYSQ